MRAQKDATLSKRRIMAPKLFLAVYECKVCGEEYEMQNCYVPSITLWCDFCENWTKFAAQRLIHQSFEWDRIEETD